MRDCANHAGLTPLFEKLFFCVTRVGSLRAAAKGSMCMYVDNGDLFILRSNLCSLKLRLAFSSTEDGYERYEYPEAMSHMSPTRVVNVAVANPVRMMFQLFGLRVGFTGFT